MRGGGHRVSPGYRFTDFDIEPRPGGKATAHIRWSRAGESDNSNMRSHTIEVFEPTRMELIVFLPQADGVDTFTY